jgi:septal ring factor EnvC (AmiA/AmiB activator)
MDATNRDGPATKYTTPARVQAWFLHRSREKWKKKYMGVKPNLKRLQNHVNDLTKSREHWRTKSEQLRQRIQELEAANAALQQQNGALKKDG